MTQETLGLSQQALESRLCAAANSLRGPVDPSDFKASCQPGLTTTNASPWAPVAVGLASW